MRRRDFLKPLFLMLIAFSGARSRTVTAKLLPRKTESYRSSSFTFNVIGQRYLELYPSEGRVSVLRERLLQKGIDEKFFVDKKLQAQRYDELNKIIREDFEMEDVLFIDGWLLSRSEARLCAYLLLG